MISCEITDKEVVDAMIQLRDGCGTAVATLLQRSPAHYLAEAITQELEDRSKTYDYSFLTGLDSVLWRMARFQHDNPAMG